MTTYGAANTATGKAFVKKQVVTTATVLALPIVKWDELNNVHGAINIARFSGKKKGAMVLVQKTDGQTLCIAVAQGPEPADGWKIVEPSTAITPLA